ncbi:methyltransferase, FxLD system [Kitasatospora sp. NA04385]|uniref:methyltransferase, FxLD system n=1 Tax=Kitasatospora sp. NA04385 TaxID=2742135 RepID=UPI0015908BE1|nr:methyltransferase, FxLD system [Kitasatospora sp. NA04385]QKW17845.1 methyltransferase, FxLD system [Kitasatospora sp. NA04385]
MTAPALTAAHWNRSYTDGIAFSALRPQEIAALAEHAPAPEGGGRALDVGCGLGDLAAHLALVGYAVDAVDLSAAALERARAAHPEAGVRWLEADVEVADLHHLLGDRPYDLVTMRLSVAFLADRTNTLHRLGHLLAPGGTLLITTPLTATTPAERRRIALDEDEIAALTSGWTDVRRLDADGLGLLVLRAPCRDTAATERSTPATGNLAIAGALAVVTNSRGRVLLGWSARGMWELPGGKTDTVEDGTGGARAETLEETAVRELAEETGLKADGAAVITLLVDHAQRVPRITGVVRAFDVTGTPAVREPEKFVRWEWFDLDALDCLGPVFAPAAQALNAIWPGTVNRLPEISAYPHDAPAPAVPGADPEAARRRTAMTEQVAAAHPRLPVEVLAALRTVERHRFLPEAGLAAAYAPDRPYVTRRGAHGQATSSVSAADLQALMLAQAAVTPGARVLEIGSGGCNAAYLAHLAGPSGHVVTVDLDPHVVHRTRRALAETGTTGVTALLGDGNHGAPAHLVPRGGFDAIVVTHAARDLAPAWSGQLADGGRLVLPLDLHTHTWSLALQRHGDRLVSTGDWIGCGFVPDTTAAPVPHTRLADDVLLWHADGPVPDTDGLARAPHGPGHERRTGVRVRLGEPYDSLHLHLLTTLHGHGGCTLFQDREPSGLTRLPGGRTTPALTAGGSLAYLVPEPTADGAGGTDGAEFTVHALGEHAPALAERMAAAVRHWDRHLRGHGYPRLTVHPTTAPDAAPPAALDLVLDKPSARLAFRPATAPA